MQGFGTAVVRRFHRALRAAPGRCVRETKRVRLFSDATHGRTHMKNGFSSLSSSARQRLSLLFGVGGCTFALSCIGVEARMQTAEAESKAPEEAPPSPNNEPVFQGEFVSDQDPNLSIFSHQVGGHHIGQFKGGILKWHQFILKPLQSGHRGRVEKDFYERVAVDDPKLSDLLPRYYGTVLVGESPGIRLLPPLCLSCSSSICPLWFVLPHICFLSLFFPSCLLSPQIHRSILSLSPMINIHPLFCNSTFYQPNTLLFTLSQNRLWSISASKTARKGSSSHVVWISKSADRRGDRQLLLKRLRKRRKSGATKILLGFDSRG